MERESGRGRRRAAGERQRWLDRSTKGIGLARGLGCFSFGEVAGRVEGCVYSCTRISSRRQRRRRPRGTGGVGPEPRVPGTSWTALTLEVGKSPTEVTCGRHVPRSPPSAIIEFASSPSCSWSLNRAVRETGANMVSKTQERALETTHSWCQRFRVSLGVAYRASLVGLLLVTKLE